MAPRKDRTARRLARSLQTSEVMPSMRVTCPETAQLHQIDLDLHPLGILIRACSAFAAGGVDCPRTCAARLDRRLRCSGKLGAQLQLRSCLRER